MLVRRLRCQFYDGALWAQTKLIEAMYEKRRFRCQKNLARRELLIVNELDHLEALRLLRHATYERASLITEKSYESTALIGRRHFCDENKERLMRASTSSARSTTPIWTGTKYLVVARSDSDARTVCSARRGERFDQSEETSDWSVPEHPVSCDSDGFK